MTLAIGRTGGPHGSIVDGDFVFRAEDFRQIAAMLHADAGVCLTDAKATLVYARLVKRLRSLGLKSFRDYCAVLAQDGGADERQKMIAALTTHVTRFFRERHHFEHMRGSVLPALAAKARRGGRVRLWSAGCSIGLEAYSIAMTLLSLMPDAADHDIRILASDIDAEVIEEGRAGRFDQAAMEGVSPAERMRFFEAADGRGKVHTVVDDLRRLVVFRELNLVGTWPMGRPFDVIFCRNVAIYFDDETQSRLWTRLAAQLVEGGTLYIGHSERLTGPARSRFVNAGITIYRRDGSLGA